MPFLQDLPLEVLLDNLLPYLRLKDLLSLSCTSRYFSAVGNENILWKRKLKVDYNFDGTGSARISGWKFIYKGIRDPQVYVWGQNREGRLGFGSTGGNVPSPTHLKIPHSRIVSIVAGGWSFHALDSNGRIHAWGQLGEGFSLNSNNFADPTTQAHFPMVLSLEEDTYITSLKCGRSFAMALDKSMNVWMITSWGRPYKLNAPELKQPGTSIAQIECGWSIGAALNTNGEIYIWWPRGIAFMQKEHEKYRALAIEDMNMVEASDGILRCYTWQLNEPPMVLLPPIPKDLPPLQGEEKQKTNYKIVQIAGGEYFIAGLTDGGHVLILRFSSDDNQPESRWTYLAMFSDIRRLKESGAFEKVNLATPTTFQVTSISAHFRTICAYSPGSSAAVLISTSQELGQETEPVIIKSLQNKPIVSIHLGDYHFGALTGDGKLLTWGQYSAGALGLGHPDGLPIGSPGGYATKEDREHRRAPPTVEIPTEVTFGKPGSKKFCFAAAAAGWHFGALVIDLEPDQGGDEDTSMGDSDDSLGHISRIGQARTEDHHSDRRLHHVRVGFAGRGHRGLSLRGLRGPG